MQLEHLQKICDINDWSDSRIDQIIRDELHTTPNYHRKQWEFAMIYLALLEKKKLHEKSQGIAFGAGRERLLFSIANKVGHILATDLYKTDSLWVGARTSSPKEWLLAAAPFPVNPARLDAAFMDMTAVSHAPNSIDFCYSACSFEHIGKEKATFVKHLADVAKILKKGGIYAFTTELNHGETIANPHNFFFSLKDLLEIVAESGLSAEPVFDGRIARTRFNWPSVDPAAFGLRVLQQPVITPIRNGRIFTSTLLILTKKARGTVSVLGYDDTYKWLQTQWNVVTAELWQTWRSVDPYAGMSKTPVGHEGMTIPVPRPDAPVFHTAWLHFGDGPVDVSVTISSATSFPEIACRIVERPANHVTDRKLKAESKMTTGHRQMNFAATHDKVYAIFARGSLPPDALVTISVRKSVDSAQKGTPQLRAA